MKEKRIPNVGTPGGRRHGPHEESLLRSQLVQSWQNNEVQDAIVCSFTHLFTPSQSFAVQPTIPLALEVSGGG